MIALEMVNLIKHDAHKYPLSYNVKSKERVTLPVIEDDVLEEVGI
jgi:hypothetical protein